MKRFSRKIIIIALLCAVSSIGIKAYAKTVPIVTQVGIVNASSLRLRSAPSTTSTTITTAPNGDYVIITGKTGSWYQVSYNLTPGYMHEKYLDTHLTKNVELGYGVITANRVNLRSGPGTTHRSLSQANMNERAYVIGFNHQWYKVIYKETICYIRSDYLELTQIPYENQKSTNEPIFFVNGKSTGISPSAQALAAASNTNIRSKIVNEANKYLGVPYSWGGSSPSGFDCSGFVQYVLKQCAITVPRTTELQVQVGTYMKQSDLRPGDLVFLQNTYRAGVSHVGIYIGNNQMIHASSSKGVTISDLTTAYYREHYHSARRIV